ncbi:MAG TPA: substrate-binding domain-containing protein [Candidatus Limnocylindria bacterium]|nr:substrate-binding domain-containing protein [Candidatus Limnocylindria bacterium]
MSWLDRIVAYLKASSALILMGGLLLYGLWPWLPLHARADVPRTVVFYGFSILDHSITHDVFPAFQKQWRARTGESIDLISSFAGSGTITNQVIMGVPVDLTLLALEADAYRLVEAGVVRHEGWRQLPFNGVVNRTPIVIVVRPGNPKGIRDFSDLARPGMRIVHPDPLTSGGANWAIVAEYGAGQRANPADPDAGFKLLLGIWRNVVAQAASARGARTQFDLGFGDALITYEQEGLWDLAKGEFHGEIVYPRSTILTEHTLVEVSRNVSASERELVDSLASFMWSEPAQQMFVRNGFRSVNEALVEADTTYKRIEDPFLIGDWGGWARAKREIVEGVWRARVLKELGQ